MSTKERYGSEVWNALLQHQSAHERGECGMWASAVVIADRAGVTPVTARKYLKLLASMNKAIELRAGAASYFMVTLTTASYK